MFFLPHAVFFCHGDCLLSRRHVFFVLRIFCFVLGSNFGKDKTSSFFLTCFLSFSKFWAGVKFLKRTGLQVEGAKKTANGKFDQLQFQRHLVIGLQWNLALCWTGGAICVQVGLGWFPGSAKFLLHLEDFCGSPPNNQENKRNNMCVQTRCSEMFFFLGVFGPILVPCGFIFSSWEAAGVSFHLQPTHFKDHSIFWEPKKDLTRKMGEFSVKTAVSIKCPRCFGTGAISRGAEVGGVWKLGSPVGAGGLGNVNRLRGSKPQGSPPNKNELDFVFRSVKDWKNHRDMVDLWIVCFVEK